MLKSFPHFFVNILPACFKKVVTQGGNFSYRMVILHRTLLNPIENIFHIVKWRLHQDALDQQITRKDFATFSARVRTTLESIPIDMVDRTILSMGKRINEIIKRKG